VAHIIKKAFLSEGLYFPTICEPPPIGRVAHIIKKAFLSEGLYIPPPIIDGRIKNITA
jgi:hypothetical protein